MSTPNRFGFEFKPWPLVNFLGTLLGVSVLFVAERLLPAGTLSYPGLLGGAVASITLTYLNYCGLSLLTSPLRTKAALILLLLGLILFFGGLAELLIHK